MQRTQYSPGDVIGYVNGKPVRMVAGGSTPAPPAEQPTPTSIPNITSTADGSVITGTDPRPTFTQVAPGANPATVQGKTFTAEDIEAARRQEKDKLYPQLQTLQQTVAELTQAREAELAAEREARETAEREAEEARRKDTDTRTLLEEQEQRFQAKLAEIEQQRQQEQQVMQMERQFQELQTYKVQALAAASDSIIPQLAEEVTAAQHTTREEVDAHIARLAATSERIMQDMVAAQQAARAGMRGAPITAPPAGPLENYSANDPVLEAANNGSLTMQDYIKNRDRLLGSAGQMRSQGLYG